MSNEFFKLQAMNKLKAQFKNKVVIVKFSLVNKPDMLVEAYFEDANLVISCSDKIGNG